MTLTTTVRNRYSAASYILCAKPIWIRRTAMALAICMLPALAQVAWETLHGCPLGCTASNVGMAALPLPLTADAGDASHSVTISTSALAKS